MTLQKSNWIGRLLTLGVLATILSLGTVSLSFSSQLHDGESGPATLLDQTASAQKPLDGIWLGVVEVSGIKIRLILRVSRRHRPFLVLADHLTQLGIAVLRVDDRGMGGSSRGSETATSENYAKDVLAGVEFLKSRAG